MTETWNIIDLKRKPDSGLVFEVIYVVVLNLDGFQGSHGGIVELDGSFDDPNFIPFNSLTEEIVIDWVKDKIGEDEIIRIQSEISALLEERIESERNPEFLTGTPWGQN